MRGNYSLDVFLSKVPTPTAERQLLNDLRSNGQCPFQSRHPGSIHIREPEWRQDPDAQWEQAFHRLREYRNLIDLV